MHRCPSIRGHTKQNAKGGNKKQKKVERFQEVTLHVLFENYSVCRAVDQSIHHSASVTRSAVAQCGLKGGAGMYVHVSCFP